MTGVPVHMDGSCNGLQHYAALGRDVAGAAEVNLINAEQPSDPYRSVAERLQVIMDGMSRDESNPQQQQLAKFLTSRIGRKVVKQTVMTSVYGVTFIGARAQIHRQLVDLTRGEPNVSEDMLFKCSGLLARETLNALAQTFSGAQAVMTWLARVASFVAKKTGKPITWVTPLGLPVLQPYRSSGSYQVKTCLQHVVLARDTDHLPVNSRKQSTAFAPNFIHSIDSTHLLMTASDCAARGLTFAGDVFVVWLVCFWFCLLVHVAGVHDSFWTHPGDVDEMGRSLRKVCLSSFAVTHTTIFDIFSLVSHLQFFQQFVQLHSLPLLEDFRSQILQQVDISCLFFFFTDTSLNPQFRTQLSRRDPQAEAKYPISFDEIEKKFDEECPLPPRGDLVRGFVSELSALYVFSHTDQDLKEVEQASFFFS
jgi:DNA-directed RNA polymerase